MTPDAAAERASAEPVAPSSAVAKAWAKEAGGSSAAVRTLYATYGVVQGLDMIAMNVATAAVVANNIRNAQRLT